uniref:Uncharacterized protein n=1 Tax=Pyrodinium bahamense TaxID=73915 RepID=A0A7S0FMU9_9DINO|mmetsp:Transcript_38883/g.108173  ORF Transcript_38883/g.108173 Transcript_38883/m.108173 type:complete len:767 (+) Transcript_38883:60-2360(+)
MDPSQGSSGSMRLPVPTACAEEQPLSASLVADAVLMALQAGPPRSWLEAVQDLLKAHEERLLRGLRVRRGTSNPRWSLQHSPMQDLPPMASRQSGKTEHGGNRPDARHGLGTDQPAIGVPVAGAADNLRSSGPKSATAPSLPILQPERWAAPLGQGSRPTVESSTTRSESQLVLPQRPRGASWDPGSEAGPRLSTGSRLTPIRSQRGSLRRRATREQHDHQQPEEAIVAGHRPNANVGSVIRVTSQSSSPSDSDGERTDDASAHAAAIEHREPTSAGLWAEGVQGRVARDVQPSVLGRPSLLPAQAASSSTSDSSRSVRDLAAASAGLADAGLAARVRPPHGAGAHPGSASTGNRGEPPVLAIRGVLPEEAEGSEQGSAQSESQAGDEDPLGGPGEWGVTSPLLLRIWGVLPWDGEFFAEEWGLLAILSRHWRPSALYQHTVLVLAIGAAGESLANCGAAVNSASDMPGQSVHFWLGLADAVVAVGALAGLLASRRLAHTHTLGSTDSLLVEYAQRDGLVLAWHRTCRRQSALLVLAWVLMAFCRKQAQSHGAGGSHSLGPRDYVHLAAFVFESGLAVALLHAFLHPVTLLVFMVDSYCFKFIQRQKSDSTLEDWEAYVSGWNLLQAMLRRISGICQWGILILQTMTLWALLVVGIAMVQDTGTSSAAMSFWFSLAFLPLAAVAVWLLHQAAEVTDRCAGLPAFVNSIHSNEKALDPHRHFLVEYINYSRAGFHVKEMRITGGMVIKCYSIGLFVVIGLINSFITE